MSKLTIEQKNKFLQNIKNFSITKNGVCLSNEYIGFYDLLDFKCNICFYMWQDTSINVRKGRWCPSCTGRLPITIEKFQKIAKEKNGICLSTVYISSKEKLDFFCNICPYKFSMTPSSLWRGDWCPKCGGTLKLTIEEFQQIAKDRGGECLSTEYVNSKTKLLFQCKNKDEPFWSRPDQIKEGSWCPHCQIPLSELICKEYFEQLFGKNFISIRPDWLKNPKTGYNLQLDGYCSELNLAFEHNGIYHYKEFDFKSKNINISKHGAALLERVQERDLIKLELCKQKNIKLIIIPSLFIDIQEKSLCNFIINECNKQNIIIPNKNIDVSINVNKLIKEYRRS